MYFIKEAWNKVMPETISNYFKLRSVQKSTGRIIHLSSLVSEQEETSRQYNIMIPSQ